MKKHDHVFWLMCGLFVIAVTGYAVLILWIFK